MESVIYWLWLQEILGYGNNRFKKIMLTYGNVKSLFESNAQERKLSGLFTQKELKRMESIENLKNAEKTFEKCQRLGYDIITYEDKRYPKRLRNISNPPCVIYTWGRLPDIDNNISIGIVGTRKATSYGCRSAFEIAYELGKKNSIVISGCALGIDSESHKGALQSGGLTVGILGCGINTEYLIKNSSLRHAISNQGCIISEFPPDYEAFAWNFPIRNRIISGLSLGVLLIEAGKRSGSLITADLALEQNKDVFVFDGNTRGTLSIGTKKLKDEGAIPINTAEDILKEYEYLIPSLLTSRLSRSGIRKKKEEIILEKEEEDIKKKEESEKILNELSEEEKIIYNLLLKGDKNIDEIIVQSKMNSSKVLATLTMLELKDVIVKQVGRMYKLKNK